MIDHINCCKSKDNIFHSLLKYALHIVFSLHVIMDAYTAFLIKNALDVELQIFIICSSYISVISFKNDECARYFVLPFIKCLSALVINSLSLARVIPT